MTTALRWGQPAPAFSLPSTLGRPVSLEASPEHLETLGVDPTRLPARNQPVPSSSARCLMEVVDHDGDLCELHRAHSNCHESLLRLWRLAVARRGPALEGVVGVGVHPRA